MVAIRPLLPDLEDSEVEAIIDATKDFVIGYYSGPLYLKQETVKVLLPGFKIEEEKQPHWMLGGNHFQEVVKDRQMEILISLVKKAGKQFFDGAATGVDYLRKMKKYNQPRN